MTRWALRDGDCYVGDEHLLRGVGTELTLEGSSAQEELRGVFVRAKLPTSRHRHVLCLGRPLRLQRWVGCYRFDPFWMQPRVGTCIDQLPRDTQYVLLELVDGEYLLVVPLPAEPYHGSLESHAHELVVVLDSGAPEVTGEDALPLYLLRGNDPFEMMKDGAREVCERLGEGRLRSDKAVPAFVDLFGWCTWDAFYREVDPAGVERGLESFCQGGVRPRLVILDDGWQSVDEPTNEGRVNALAANSKFGGELASIVSRARQEHGVVTFMVWHAVFGYWGGAHPDALAKYAPQPILRWYSPEVLSHRPAMNADYCGPTACRPAADRLSAFYDDYHAWLEGQGVDGVKVDNQSSLEGLAHDAGGRVALWKQVRRALEGSARRHFDGNLINCMSNASECYYFAQDSTLTRTSTDFWPRQPETHGLHLYTNALVSLWFGEFNLPDWDMFQSGHPVGHYHAAARAISGGPVYVSDPPDGHDFELLRRLVLSDGTVARCLDIARPTRDCLFQDPTQEGHLLKVFNRNAASSVVGAFNARYRPDAKDVIVGTVGPSDVPGLEAGSYAMYLVEADTLLVVDRHSIELSLDTLGYEIATLAPIQGGVAVIGLKALLNPGGAVSSVEYGPLSVAVELRDGGPLLCYAERAPSQVTWQGQGLSATYVAERARLEVQVPGSGKVELVFAAG